MNIELTEKDVELILRALGKEKKFCQDSGFHGLAHMHSDLQARIKNAVPVSYCRRSWSY
jgi:hypothetical protein